MMKKGEIIPECKGCIYLREDYWDDKDYISFINFNNWTICNEHCVYCWLNDENMTHLEQYNVYPVIKDMAERGYLKEGGHITIAGGEPCVAPEFDELLKLFIDRKLNVRVLTNATKYSDIVELGIKSGFVNIVVSVDSGTKDMFIKVKRYDFYDKVWENIRKYSSVKIKSDAVKTKFILIPNVNDTKEEIDSWIEKSMSVGVSHLAFDIEMFWYNKNKDNLPDSIFDITEYTFSKINEYKLQLELIDRGVLIADTIKNVKAKYHDKN